MAELEKVLKGLECCGATCYRCDINDCPYREKMNGALDCVRELCRDALESLKPIPWIKFELREPDEEEKAAHPNWIYVDNRPEDDEEILVSNGKCVWVDVFCNDGDQCYLDSGHEMEGCWWMPLPPLPKPPKEETGDGCD